MKLVLACEDTGTLKVVVAQHGTDTSKPSDENNPQAPVTISTHAVENSRKSKVLHLIQSHVTKNIIVTRLNGSVELYDTADLIGAEEKKVEIEKKDEKTNSEKGQEQCNNNKNDLLPLLKENKELISPYVSQDSEIFVNLLVDETGRVLVVTNKGSLFIWESEHKLDEDPMKILLPLNAEEVIEAFAIHPGKENINYVAYGGKETDLRIVKLPESKKIEKNSKKVKRGKKIKQSNDDLEVIFKAKNVSNSRLNLRVPVHIKHVLFDQSSTPENFKLYTFTASGDLRFYEASAGRKPRDSTLILPKKAPIVQAIWLNEKFVVCDNSGIVTKIEPKNGSQICQFKGQIGSVQSLYNFNDSILATTGSDRYVRVFNNETRECIIKVFVGAQCNSVIIIENNEPLRRNRSTILDEATRDTIRRKEERNEKAHIEPEEESDEEELWSKLESKITQRRKRRKLTLA